MAQIVVAGGRLPRYTRLLFVTSAEALAKLDGGDEQAIRDAIVEPHALAVLSGVATFEDAQAQIRPVLAAHRGIDGVVLIGGYDTLAAEPKDTLALTGFWTDPGDEFVGDLREVLGDKLVRLDDDRFRAWSDDFYGDRDGDGLPDLPVSRIPSDTEGAFVLTALGAPGLPTTHGTRGVRDANFVFGGEVYTVVESLHTPPPPSEPMRIAPSAVMETADLSADALYLTMHGGSGHDKTTYLAYDNGVGNPVVTTQALGAPPGGGDPAPPFGSTVLAACCYSGLVANYKASLLGENGISFDDVEALVPEESVALSFLALGVTAAAGFTGTHWVPLDSPNPFLGRPLHDLFWEFYLGDNRSPARALFEAKAAFVANTPYFTTGDPRFRLFWEAIELKTFWSSTCIGLGW